MTENYERQLQRLIDGELDQQQRSQFLRSIDANPDQWRDVALAYVEDQTWRAHANECMSDQAVNGHAPRHVSGIPDSDIQAKSAPKSPLSQVPPWKRIGPPMLMAAATLLFVVTVAIRLNTPSANDPGGNILTSQSQSNGHETLVNEPYTLRLGEQDIPLYSELDQFRDQFGEVGYQVDPRVRQQFMNAGFILESDMRFISGRSPDGHSFLIPVTELRFKPYLQ